MGQTSPPRHRSQLASESDVSPRHRVRKYTTTACESCRKRRVKCDGQKPSCKQCSKTLRQCVYSHNDRRTLEVRQQDTEALQKRLHGLESVVARLQNGTDCEATDALALIRSKKEISDVLNDIEQLHDLPSFDTEGRIIKPPPLVSSDTGQHVLSELDNEGKFQAHDHALPGQYTPWVGAYNNDDRSSSSDHINQSSPSQYEGLERDDTSEWSYSKMGNPYVKRHAGSASYVRSSEFRHPLLLSSYNKVDAAVNSFQQPSTHEAIRSDQITTMPQREPSNTERESAVGLALDIDVQQHEHVPEYDHQYLCIRPSNVFERFGNLGVASAIYTNNYPADIQTRQLLVLQKEEWATPCLTFYDDSPFARLYDNFRKVSMNHIASGMSVASILGQEDEIDVELLFRGRSSEDDLDVSNFACDVWRNILGQQDVYIVLAMTAMTARLARWMLIPSIQTWRQIPAIARPFPSQKLIPHNPSIDFCAHPIARQSLMNHYSDWISAGEQGNLSVGWPHAFDRAIFKHPSNGRRHISKEFERHISDHKVWNWTNDVLKTMPCIEDLGAIIR